MTERDAQSLLRERIEGEAPAAEDPDESGGAFDRLESLGVPPAFRVETEGQADWVLGLYADNAARAARVRANADAEIKRLAADREALDRRFGADMEGYARRALAGGKRRTVNLLNGSLKLTAYGPRVQVERDDAVLIPWAKQHAADLVTVRVTESVSRTELAKRFDVLDGGEETDPQTGEVRPVRTVVDRETGEPVPVAVVVPGGERFDVVPGSEEERAKERDAKKSRGRG